MAATTLLEREGELREIAETLDEAQEGSGRVLLIQAPAGIGKTSLLRVALERAAARDFTCLRARATELERDFAYGSIRQLLEPTVARASEAELERLFDGAAALSRPLFEEIPDAGASSADRDFSMLHGLYWLLNNLSEHRPVALAIDDIHWSDPGSLRFVNYLAPRLDGLSLAVVASSRSGESVTPDLARIAAAAETRVLRPRPLSVGATATLCRRELGDGVAPEFVSACRQMAGGNPFFLEALLREVRARGLSAGAEDVASVLRIGPASVAEAVLLRLERSPLAIALIRAVAVLGDGAGLGEAARLARLGEDEAARAADLLAAVAIEKGEGRLEFSHPIVREAVYADLGRHERAEAHARAAEILADTGASEERIAAQIVEAEPRGDPCRVELLRRVAMDALARGAPTAAVAWLRRAVAEPAPPDVEGELLLDLSLASLRLGTPEAAIERLVEAGELLRNPALSAKSVRLLGSALTWSGEADRAVEAIGSALAALGPEDRELVLLLEADRAGYAQQGSLEHRGSAAERLEGLAGLTGETPGERLVLATLGFERARSAGSEREAVAFLEGALAERRILSEQELDVAGTLYLLASGLLATDGLDLADEVLERMLADAERRASIPAQAFVLIYRGWVSFRRGELGPAEADARTSCELLTSYDILLGTSFALALLIRTLIEGGERDDAQRTLDASAVGDDIPPGMASNALLEARGLLRIASGREREGVEDLVAFGRHDELWGAANPLASRWRSEAALALGALGESDRAAKMAEEDLALARRWGAASGIGVALRADALVGSGSPSVDRLREAANVLAESPARLEEARALTDLGAALRRDNHRAEARVPLERGLELARRCGARALVERARTELRAAGGRSSDPYASGVAQLTASERRVADYAADGRSNPEIAQALFVTRKTVETHLGNVYRKLAISGRSELARALAD